MYIKRAVYLGNVEPLTSQNSYGFIIKPDSYEVKDFERMKTVRDLIEVIKKQIL